MIELILAGVGVVAVASLAVALKHGATIKSVEAELLKIEGEAVSDAKAVIARIKAALKL